MKTARCSQRHFDRLSANGRGGMRSCEGSSPSKRCTHDLTPSLFKRCTHDLTPNPSKLCTHDLTSSPFKRCTQDLTSSPFGLSLSKPPLAQTPHPFGLSLSKPAGCSHRHFDKLNANGWGGLRSCEGSSPSKLCTHDLTPSPFKRCTQDLPPSPFGLSLSKPPLAYTAHPFAYTPQLFAHAPHLRVGDCGDAVDQAPGRGTAP